MRSEREGYLAYLVRLWQVRTGGKLVWRAAVESPHTGERHAFTNMEGLFAYLEHQTSGFDLVETAKGPLESDAGDGSE